MKLVQLTCTNCGAPLEFPSDFQNVRCPHCGSTFVVQEYQGIVSLKRIQRTVKAIEGHARRTANAAEYIAVQQDILALQQDIQLLEEQLVPRPSPCQGLGRDLADDASLNTQYPNLAIIFVFVGIPALIAWWLGFTWWWGPLALGVLVVSLWLIWFVSEESRKAKVQKQLKDAKALLRELQEKARAVQPY